MRGLLGGVLVSVVVFVVLLVVGAPAQDADPRPHVSGTEVDGDPPNGMVIWPPG